MAQRGNAQEWQRALVVLSSTVVAAITISVIYWARTIFIPLALAIFLTFVFSPVVAWVQRRKVGRTTAVLLVVGLGIVITGGLGAVITSQLASLSSALPDRKATIIAKITQAKDAIFGSGDSPFSQLIDEVSNVLAPKPPSAQQDAPQIVVQTPGPGWIGQLESFASPALELVGQGAFAFLLTVFMLLKREDLRNRMIRLTGHGKVTTTTKAVDDASRRVSRFLFTQLVVNSVFGLIILAGLLLMGVKYALLWAVI
ncbi:MAG TPA: AI-2E family transporter, partial [Urbifossiella sp.]|nr:AI-2E family transporter [Urbifossiella sp.]